MFFFISSPFRIMWRAWRDLPEPALKKLCRLMKKRQSQNPITK